MRNILKKEEGIPLPDITSSKLKSEPNTVPLEVKLTDDEMTDGLAFKLNTCSRRCAKGQADTVRNDAAKMLIEFFLEWAMSGGTLKTFMQKRGWIKVPPNFYPIGFPNKQQTNSKY
jgi:hypothetical protein